MKKLKKESKGRKKL